MYWVPAHLRVGAFGCTPARCKTTHNSTCGSRLFQQLSDEHSAQKKKKKTTCSWFHFLAWNVFIIHPLSWMTKAKCVNLKKVWNGSYNSLALWSLELSFLWVSLSLCVCHFTKNHTLKSRGFSRDSPTVSATLKGVLDLVQAQGPEPHYGQYLSGERLDRQEQQR